jgi:methyl-accepting chemotaxis protein
MTTQRWTDEMIDELAESVTELKESVTELKGSVTELKESVTELKGSVTEISDSVDGLRITAQALLQVAAQSQREMELIKQRQEENDQRFNILLEEVRYLIRHNRDE